MAKRNAKYNATEVHITRSVAGLFIFAALLISVWGVRHLYRNVSFIYIIAAVLFVGGTVALGWLDRKQKKAGENLKIFGPDYWLYVVGTGAVVHVGMLIALSENLRAVVQPVMYLVVIVMYVVYITVWNLGAHFKRFACWCALACVLPFVHYQCFYDQRIFVGTNPIPMVAADTRCMFGWILLLGAGVCLLWLWKKRGMSCWKQLVLLGILSVYWLLLFWLQKHSYALTLGVSITVALYFVLMRILKQIRVIN